MALNARPDSNLLMGIEGEITLYQGTCGYNDVQTLIDGSINRFSQYGGVLLDVGQYIEFEVPQKCNIWTYATSYSDSGGSSTKPLNLFKYNSLGQPEEYQMLGPTKLDGWIKTFTDIKPGKYRVVTSARYCSLIEIFVEKSGIEYENVDISYNPEKISIKYDAKIPVVKASSDQVVINQKLYDTNDVELKTLKFSTNYSKEITDIKIK